MARTEVSQAMNRIIQRCWGDAEFRGKLLNDATGTLRANGIELPAGVGVKVLEDTDTLRHLVIPTRPGDLSDADLATVAAGLNLGTLEGLSDARSLFGGASTYVPKPASRDSSTSGSPA